MDARRGTFGREMMDESASCSVVLVYSSVSRPVKAEMHAIRGLDSPGKEEWPVANRATAAEWYVLGQNYVKIKSKLSENYTKAGKKLSENYTKEAKSYILNISQKMS